MNDFIQIMPSPSGQAILLGCLSTEYVSGLLQEVKVLLTEAVAGSMEIGYANLWKRWVAFAAEHGLVPILAHVEHLCTYFLHLATFGNSMSVALSVRAAIGFFS